MSCSVHPRVRGAHLEHCQHALHSFGPSPRARGSRVLQPPRRKGRRSIPACAGLTPVRRDGPVFGSVHPRVRGAHSFPLPGVRRTGGPSPRARGSPGRGLFAVMLLRSIPACAGLTRHEEGGRRGIPVHPRVRGAHWLRRAPPARRDGPSPRARGSPGPRRSRPPLRRSIPACAGLTLNDLRRRGPLSPRNLLWDMPTTLVIPMRPSSHDRSQGFAPASEQALQPGRTADMKRAE